MSDAQAVLQTDTSADSRSEARRDIFTDGRILLASGFKVDVHVLDLSTRGARLRLDTVFVLPDQFTVEIYCPDRTKMKVCKASRRWQEHKLAGVRFLSARTVTLK